MRGHLAAQHLLSGGVVLITARHAAGEKKSKTLDGAELVAF